jgi:hypothetical protein
MYAVQLPVAVPMSLRNPAGNTLTVMPHSFFWTIDAPGYICMGIATLFAAFVSGTERLQRLLNIFLIANGFRQLG